MSQVLMPKATAVWLIENTVLTFNQISEFCGLHPLEVQSIADGEASIGMVGYDPITNGQLTKEEIERCGADPNTKLELAEVKVPRPTTRTKGPRYTPVTRRQDRPDAIAWLVKNFPLLSDGQISKLVGTTKPTINGVRNRTHWNINNIKPRDPVALGLVSRDDLTAAIDKANRAAERAEMRKNKGTKISEPEPPVVNITSQSAENAATPLSETSIPDLEVKSGDISGKTQKEQLPASLKREEKSSVIDDESPFAALGKLLPQENAPEEEKSEKEQ